MFKSISTIQIGKVSRMVPKNIKITSHPLTRLFSRSKPSNRLIFAGKKRTYERTTWRHYAYQYTPPSKPEPSNSSIDWNYLYFVMPLTCFGLGYWQVRRLEWKEELIRARKEGLKNEPLVLDFAQEDYDPVTLPRQLSWQPVSVTGKWVHSQEILVGPRVLNSAPGYHLITPLDLGGGYRDMVNRGFIPKELASREKRPETLTKGTVTITGTLREIATKPNWVPENVPERGEWYWIDIPTLALQNHAEPIFIDSLLNEESPTKIPIGGQLNQPLTNNHFQYMITFFTLGAFLTGFSVLLIKRGGSLPPALPPHINPKKPWWNQK